jgi:hypothetical protein
MPISVQELLQRSLDLWWQSDAAMPGGGRSYSPCEQEAREAHLERFLDAMVGEAEQPPRTPGERQGTQERVLAAVAALARTALDFEERHMQVLLGGDFLRAGQAFAQAARRFDPQILGSAIYQGGRNALTMNSLQLLLGRPMELTPAILAYSLLYPYSDNYLDDPAVPPADKVAFDERFGRRLAGEEAVPANAHERAIYDLVDMIEGQFARATYPQVFASLLAIHSAQDRSIRLLRRAAVPYEVDVLGISLEKGGASVLADGYLVAGTLTPAQEWFLFGWGAFLQLVDDLQDVEPDSQGSLMTIFSQTAGHWPLDNLTNHTWSFGLRVQEGLACFEAPGMEPLKELMARSAVLLLVEAAGGAGKLYSRPYLQELEKYSPFRFSYLQQRRRKLARQNAALMRLIEVFAAEATADSPPWKP